MTPQLLLEDAWTLEMCWGNVKRQSEMRTALAKRLLSHQRLFCQNHALGPVRWRMLWYFNDRQHFSRSTDLSDGSYRCLYEII